MHDFLVTTYGDPCGGCGFAFSCEDADAIAVITAAPERYESLLAGRDGTARAPDLAWNAVAYVMHAADNTRIWSERVAAAAFGDPRVVAYDEAALGAARGYAALPVAGALWSLRRSIGDFEAAWALSGGSGFTLAHPEQGALPPATVLRVLAHELRHHGDDVARCIGS